MRLKIQLICGLVFLGYAYLSHAIEVRQSIDAEIKQLEQRVKQTKQSYDEIMREREQEIKAAQNEVTKYDSWIKDAHDVEREAELKPQLDEARKRLAIVETPAKDALRALQESEQKLAQARAEMQKLMETSERPVAPEIEEFIATQKVITDIPEVMPDFITVELHKLANKPPEEQIARIQEMVQVLQEINPTVYASSITQLKGLVPELKKVANQKIGINKEDTFYNKPSRQKQSAMIEKAKQLFAELDKNYNPDDLKSVQETVKRLKEFSASLERYGQSDEIAEVKDIVHQTIKDLSESEHESIDPQIVQAVQDPEKNIAVLVSNHDKVVSVILKPTPMQPQQGLQQRSTAQVIENIKNTDPQLLQAVTKTVDQFEKNLQKNNMAIVSQDTDNQSKVIAGIKEAMNDKKQQTPYSLIAFEKDLNESKLSIAQIKKETLNEVKKLGPTDQLVDVIKVQAEYTSFPPISAQDELEIQQVQKERKRILAAIYEPFRVLIKDLAIYLKNLFSSRSQRIADAQSTFTKTYTDFINAIGLDSSKIHTKNEIEQAMLKLRTLSDATRIRAMNKAQADMLNAINRLKEEAQALHDATRFNINAVADLIVQVGNIAFQMPERKIKNKAGRYLSALDDMYDQQKALNKEIQNGLKDLEAEMATLPKEWRALSSPTTEWLSLGHDVLDSLSKLATGNVLNNLVKLDRMAQDYQAELKTMEDGAKRSLGIKPNS